MTSLDEIIPRSPDDFVFVETLGTINALRYESTRIREEDVSRLPGGSPPGPRPRHLSKDS